MKISGIKTFPVSTPGRNYLFVIVETDEGLYGVGEFGITWRERAGLGAIEHLKPHLLGQDPHNIEYLWQKMLRGDFFPGGRINAAAISAIDIALWDIKGKALDQPIHMLLGGRLRERVPCYTGIGGGTPEQAAEQACEKKAEGFRYLRLEVRPRDSILEPSQAVRDAVAEFAAVRDAVGEDVELCIDVHTRLDPPDAIRLGRLLEPYAPYFIEDPLRCENPQTYRLVRQHIGVPLAVGEHYATKWEFRQMIEEELLDYARIDLCVVGGLTEARKITNWCETHYIKLVPHNPLGPVSAAACLQLDLATDNFAVQETWHYKTGFFDDLFPRQIVFDKGDFLVPEGPGLGIEFNEDAAAAYRFEERLSPQLKRRDGSFTNW